MKRKVLTLVLSLVLVGCSQSNNLPKAQTNLNPTNTVTKTTNEPTENKKTGLENVKFPIVQYERHGLLFGTEKGEKELKKLEEKLISPLTDYYNEKEIKLIAIIITIPTDIGIPYDVNTVSVPGVGSGGFIFGKRELDYDFWKPECMGPCEFSELFKKKYPQIVN